MSNFERRAYERVSVGSQESAIDYYEGRQDQRILLKDDRGKAVTSRDIMRKRKRKNSHCLNSIEEKR